MSDYKPSIASLLAAGAARQPRFHGGGVGYPIFTDHEGWFERSYRAQGSMDLLNASVENGYFVMQAKPSSSARDRNWSLPGHEGGENLIWGGAPEALPLPSTCEFAQLEAYRSDVASLARFSRRIDHATWYLSAADHFHVDLAMWHRPAAKTRARSWLGALAGQCFARWKTARNLLLRDHSIPEESASLYRSAFWTLCELTPADMQLKHLFELDPSRARRELVKHVDAYAQQLTLATDLAETLDEQEVEARQEVAAEDGARLKAVQASLLEKAGGSLTLTEVAERLGISRQAVHKKIGTNALLGVMVGEALSLPAAQFVEKGDRVKAVPHLRDVLSLFAHSGAGAWSAMQYLVEPDPALGGEIPLERLKEGQQAQVVAAARAYLGLDEG